MKNTNPEQIIEGVRNQLKDILDGSQQAIYVYLDDTHKICNPKFAAMLGYGSTGEWENVKRPFADTFVAPASQHALVSTYQSAMTQRAGSVVEVTWKKKSGGQVATNVILVPFSYQNELLALHFLTTT